jgi:hypothetical protein
MNRSLIAIARPLFPRAHGTEAIVALSAVVVGTIGAIATLVTLVMLLLGR